MLGFSSANVDEKVYYSSEKASPTGRKPLHETAPGVLHKSLQLLILHRFYLPGSAELASKQGHSPSSSTSCYALDVS
jgi:hypothetical protein